MSIEGGLGLLEVGTSYAPQIPRSRTETLPKTNDRTL